MAETCERCHLMHEIPNFEDAQASLPMCIDAQAAAMLKLLKLIGDPTTCRACRAPIYFVQHANGKHVPYTPAGLNHFIDCPQAAQFGRKAEK